MKDESLKKCAVELGEAEERVRVALSAVAKAQDELAAARSAFIQADRAFTKAELIAAHRRGGSSNEG